MALNGDGARVANVRLRGHNGHGASLSPLPLALRHFPELRGRKGRGRTGSLFRFSGTHASAKEAKVGVNAYVLTGFRKDRRETVFQFSRRSIRVCPLLAQS